MSGTCDAETFKTFMMRDMSTNRKTLVVKPTIKDTKHLFFIDDLNMCDPDKFDVKGTHELLRSWFDHEGWYTNDADYKGFNKVKNIQFLATVSINEDNMGPGSKPALDERLMWHFTVLTHINKDQNYSHLFEIYS
jgi:hypothetical protein